MEKDSHGYPEDTHNLQIVIWTGMFTVVVIVMVIWLRSYFVDVQLEYVQKMVLSVENPKLQELQALEEEELTTYGWVDEEVGRIRIPIDRAMELVVSEADTARSER
jgi:hypothetical protein